MNANRLKAKLAADGARLLADVSFPAACGK
jgi:hypothetical protein